MTFDLSTLAAVAVAGFTAAVLTHFLIASYARPARRTGTATLESIAAVRVNTTPAAVRYTARRSAATAA